MDELFILTLPRRVRNNCRVDAQTTYESAGFQPSCRPGAAHAWSRSFRPGADSARGSATGSSGASGCYPVPGTGGRSHPGGEKLRTNAVDTPDRRREKEFFEAIASPAGPSRLSGEIPRLCPRRTVEIWGFAPRRPRTPRRIVRGLTPVRERVKQPSHSRSSRPHQGERAGRIGRLPGRQTRTSGPDGASMIRPRIRGGRGAARECRRGTIRYG
jgi:hypothetical protein